MFSKDEAHRGPDDPFKKRHYMPVFERYSCATTREKSETGAKPIKGRSAGS
jgi:hypothetical protein